MGCVDVLGCPDVVEGCVLKGVLGFLGPDRFKQHLKDCLTAASFAFSLLGVDHARQEEEAANLKEELMVATKKQPQGVEGQPDETDFPLIGGAAPERRAPQSARVK